MSVLYKNEEFKPIMKDGLLTLDLSEKGIKIITEVKGLETLTDLQVLNLSNNQINEIEGLDNLIKLRELDLSNNKITEINGLKNLINLRKLNLENNRFINIKGFENLINLKDLSLGEMWLPVSSDGKPFPLFSLNSKKGLFLNFKELVGIERKIVKSNVKNIVAYCRVKLKQSGYTKRLVPAGTELEKLEEKIEKMLKKYDRMIKRAIKEQEKLKQKQAYSLGRRI